ncbi:MAG: EAL domain-containing protein [Sphaerochaeta sp.]|jgi:EAL domain-containing protein (putative c-di-GMP-specific phosphodiesterase class I)/GGDEF domain-containing protein|nr:EAL domain-containing protein [Sphaerochaeta sp.]
MSERRPGHTLKEKPTQTSKPFLGWFIVLFVVFVVMIGIGVRIPKENLLLSFGDSSSYSSGWTDPSFRNVEYEHKAYLLHEGESMTMEHVLPEQIPAGTVITFLSSHFHIVVTVDGNAVYEEGTANPGRFGKELGRHWVTIPLDPTYAGKTLRVTLTNQGIGRYLELYTARIGQVGAIRARIFRQNLYLFGFCLVMLCLTIWLLVYYFILRHWKVAFNYQCYLYLGLFTLASSLWIFSDSDFFFFFSGNASFRYMLSHFSFMVMPLFLTLFYRELSPHYRKTLGYFIYAYFIYLYVILTLYALNLVPLNLSLVTTHIFCFVMVAILALFVLSESVRYHDKTMVAPFLALLVLAIPSAVNLAMFYTKSFYDNTEPYRWGLMCFVVIVFAVTVRSSMNDFKDIRFARYYKRLAYVDEITHGNTANRFVDEAKRLVSEGGRSYYFVHYDLVQFAMIQDVLGRSEGNAILKRVYDLIASCLHENETLGYLGDAKFGMLVMAESNDVLYVRLKKIWTLLSGVDSRNLGEHSIVVQSCAAKWGDPKTLIETITSQALLAYGNPLADYLPDVHCYLYNDACGMEMQRQRMLEERMQQALRDKEFVVYLQPTIRLSDGTLSGAEALIRWRNPELGLLQPGEFIPLFEKNGFITEIDLYVFKEVCMLINRWLAQGITPPVVSVNISRTAVNRYEVFRKYEQIVRESGVPVSYLDLQISEHSAYKDVGVIKQIIDRIHSWGATVTIDDFGCDSSNIQALGVLDFDSIKIDRSFFAEGFPENERKTTLVKGVINMAGSLGLSVIAQGIETHPQVVALKNLDCSYIQGYVYSPPIAISEFEQKYLPKAQKKGD